MTQETVKFDTLNYQEMFFDTLQISSKRIAFFVFYTKILFFISTVLSKFFFSFLQYLFLLFSIRSVFTQICKDINEQMV